LFNCIGGIVGPLTVAKGGAEMSLGTILLIILVLLLIGALPNWGYSRAWGRGPAGIIGIILIVVLILVLLDRI
jgi:hypothetical protein